jgi:NitT/TauT family transport system substrate-binding protein
MYRSVLAILLAYVELRLQRGQIWMEIAMLPVSQCLHLRAALALLLALAVPPTLSAGAALAQTKITAGMVAHGPPQWPQYIATELGWLKQDNIELDFVTAGGGGAQQLAAGALDICHSGYPDFARASLQGAPVKIIINDIVASPYAVFAKPTIREIADLKGRLISIGGNNDITFIYIKPFLAAAGLKTSDVDFIFAKAAADRFSALAAGGIDATILNHPTYSKAVSLGFSNLGDTKPYAEDIPFTVWAANMPWAEKNRNTLAAFARNYKRGVRWLYDAANKELAIDILMKYARQARKDLEEAYDYQVTRLKLYGLDGDVADKTYDKMAEGLLEIGFIKRPFPPKSAIFDGSFVQQATN